MLKCFGGTRHLIHMDNLHKTHPSQRQSSGLSRASYQLYMCDSRALILGTVPANPSPCQGNVGLGTPTRDQGFAQGDGFR